MTVGPGKYDDICTMVREETDALVAIVIIVGGKYGSGFSVQSYGQSNVAQLPEVLETIAQQIRKDMN